MKLLQAWPFFQAECTRPLHSGRTERIVQEMKFSLQGLQSALVVKPPSYQQQMDDIDRLLPNMQYQLRVLPGNQYRALTQSHYKICHQSMGKVQDEYVQPAVY